MNCAILVLLIALQRAHEDQNKVWSCYFTKFCILIFLFRTFMGRHPLLLVKDLDMIKEVLVKQFNNFDNRSVSTCLSILCGPHLYPVILKLYFPESNF